MAEAINDTPGLPAVVPGPSPERLSLPGADFIRGAASMPAVRQLGLLFAIAVSAAVAVVAVLWMQTPDYRPLTGIVSSYQANDVVALLDADVIAHRVDERTGMILVPTDQYHRARMALAGGMALDGRQAGYELLDEEQGFGVSQFMEAARHRRSIEGELARSISSLDAVQSARVLLATPKSTTFLRDRRKPSASVSVRLLASQRLSDSQIKGITNLVAAAVPELMADDVAVVDQTGKLLSVPEADASLEQSERQLRYVARVEQQLQEKISNLLAPMVGPDRFGAQVNAEVDFTRSEEAEELFNPDFTAVRSEQVLEEENVGESLAIGIPGALSNQPAATQPNPELAGTESATEPQRRSRSERTRNFEVDRTLSFTQHTVGSVRRLTVSVVVDHLPVTDAETGETTFEPWNEADIDQLAASVKSAIGYTASRGDVVSVVNRAFFNPAVETLEAPAFWTEPWFIDLLKQALVGLLLLFLAIGLIRPLFRNLSKAGAMVEERHNLALAQITRGGDPGAVPALPGGAHAGLRGPASAGGYEGKVDTVRSLVEEDPGRVAQVVKHWVTTDE